ncbi:hypothetical protein HK100_002691 [Physocladia obscura]|uniref:AB hydrolase-1 domain-containing protein n=1 Tax=Physocladia obscura TaxID=109957 RepID=A0AAD5XA24_9FUNG|nr:hypothetical protein HK100_002691 [Physocladia obscura]
MLEALSQDWNTGNHSSLISIGTHGLYISASGQDRKPGEPIVLLMQGMGSTIDEWIKVKRSVEQFARWVQYDRSGFGKSEDYPSPPEKITTVMVARELDILLTNAQIDGPFLIICHSWGGMTSREFIHLRPKEVVGIVFLDASTETSIALSYNQPFVMAVNGNLDFIESTDISQKHKLSDEEWKAVLTEQRRPRHQRTEGAEGNGAKEGPVSIIEKKQLERQILGNHPVSVLRANTPKDIKNMMEAGIAAGNGTEEDIKQYKELVDKWGLSDHEGQSRLLGLSSLARYSYTAENCHNVQMTDPELVVDEIKWIWAMWWSSGGSMHW